MDYYYNKELGCNFYEFAREFYTYSELIHHLSKIISCFEKRLDVDDGYDYVRGIECIENHIHEAIEINERTKKVV